MYTGTSIGMRTGQRCSIGTVSSTSPRFGELAFRAGPVAQIVITGEDTVAMINQQAETTFGLSARDIGRLLRDLEVSYRLVELRHLEQAKVERRSAQIQDVQWQRPGKDTVWFEIHINPLVDADNGLLGTSIGLDVTATRALLDKVVQTNRQLEAAYEELQSTNEELEITNEELQSTVEELTPPTRNCSPPNEELETMNEELQSANDELRTINETLPERSVELDDAKSFVSSLVNSIELGMTVVDREMGGAVEPCWRGIVGIALDDRRHPLPSRDIGLPIDQIKLLIGRAFVDPGRPSSSSTSRSFSSSSRAVCGVLVPLCLLAVMFSGILMGLAHAVPGKHCRLFMCRSRSTMRAPAARCCSAAA